MKVRFKKKYKGDGKEVDDFPSLLYELNQDNPVPEYDEVTEKYGMCYDVKLLGFVIADLMEIVEVETENDTEAVDVFIELGKS